MEGGGRREGRESARDEYSYTCRVTMSSCETWYQLLATNGSNPFELAKFKKMARRRALTKTPNSASEMNE